MRPQAENWELSWTDQKTLSFVTLSCSKVHLRPRSEDAKSCRQKKNNNKGEESEFRKQSSPSISVSPLSSSIFQNQAEMESLKEVHPINLLNFMVQKVRLSSINYKSYWLERLCVCLCVWLKDSERTEHWFLHIHCWLKGKKLSQLKLWTALPFLHSCSHTSFIFSQHPSMRHTCSWAQNICVRHSSQSLPAHSSLHLLQSIPIWGNHVRQINMYSLRGELTGSDKKVMLYVFSFTYTWCYLTNDQFNYRSVQ